MGFLKGDTSGTASCECHNCILVYRKRTNVNFNGSVISLSLNATKMILCGDCGNKRCPKASNHRNACTNSNELGQEGSLYK